MSENTIDLDFGTTAQKQQDGEKLPVVLLALDQGKYDMARSLDELRALADANGMEAVARSYKRVSLVHFVVPPATRRSRRIRRWNRALIRPGY